MAYSKHGGKIDEGIKAFRSAAKLKQPDAIKWLEDRGIEVDEEKARRDAFFKQK
ncbi:hypothetical protein FACS1894195_5000 [Bacteroidia bacterium]|nr:hypothetical protein FACS1894195_5000 [Bacteroidia bacterium]